jgi:gamma-glutamyltranspeptidase/glutathione hydrolase
MTWLKNGQKKIEEDALQLAENNLNIIPESWTASIGHTTHLTAADDQGNVVSLTQTIGPNMGSKVASKDLGFLYAVSLGGYLGEYNPGDRLNSHISPTLFLKNGIIHLAIGAAGGSRIITAITQVAHRYLSQKNNLKKALYLPRVYPFEDTLWIEDHDGIRELNAEFDPDVYPIKMIDEKARFGRVHAVSYDSITKTWTGAADPDWEGTVEYHLKP